MRGRLVSAAALTAACVLGWAAPAGADPAGPTDYETTIVSIEPPTPSIEVAIIGGDSFVQLSVEPGTTVEVTGYEGEPYLLFEPDGTVLRNERSPARWYNDDRYGDTDAPADADADAEPDWRAVASDGSYAWHDHRAHWMNEAKPPGADPGDTILEAVIPLRVAGEPVLVTVRSVLLPSPSLLPTAIGALAGFVLVVAVRTSLGETGLVAGGAFASLAALISGTVAYFSVPPETGPSVLLWGLPLVAAAVIGAWLWVRNSALATTSAATTIAPALVLVAGLELLAWTWVRREALVRAFIPTDFPQALDRGLLAGAIIVGFAMVGYAIRNLGGERLAR